MSSIDLPRSAAEELLEVHVVEGIDERFPRVIYIREFGGFGNDAVAFAAPDLISHTKRAASSEAMRSALKSLGLPRPMALQVGCVPQECEVEIRNVIEEAFSSGLGFVAKIGEARLFRATAPATSMLQDISSELRLETVDRPGHDLEPWLAETLGERGYPRSYVRHMVASGKVASPLVVVSGDGQPVAMVVQEATDFSLGALYVVDSFRRHGIGKWILARMTTAIFEKTGLSAASLVELGNEPSERLHEQTGWTAHAESLIWLAFT